MYDYFVFFGMEFFVEVNNFIEFLFVFEIGFKVIGVNNCNLYDFNVDMFIIFWVNVVFNGWDVVFCVLSGILSYEDVEKYVKEGVKGVFVGEVLMWVSDIKVFFWLFIGLLFLEVVFKFRLFVKICGICFINDVKFVINVGVDFFGVIFVFGIKCCIFIFIVCEIFVFV